MTEHDPSRTDEIRDPDPEQQDPESGAATQPGAGDSAGGGEEQGPDASELDADPAYNPDQQGLKDLKGG
jgi:hypothetical protein